MDDDADERDDTKRRSRNLSEKKRRDQFNSLVNDLSALISTSSRKMDKSTVLKSTIAFLKHHNEATDRSKVFEIQHEWKPSFLSNDEFTQLMLESLDGFIIVFGSRGPIFYTSDSVTAQLGYLPCDLSKMTIFDLAYEMDHENLLNVFLNPKPVIEATQTDISARNQITFFLHLKRGGTDDRDRNSYELVKFVGYFRNDANVDVAGQNTHTALPYILQRSANTNELDQKLIFVGTGRLQMPQMIREITISDPTCCEFTSKHSMEWKFLFLDHRAPPIIGYMPFEVLGTSGYDYYHFDDIDDIVSCHEELMHAGKGKSGFYRFLTKGQQWIWLQTDFYVSYNQFNAKPDYVVCTHKVINYTDVLKYHKSEHPKSTNATSTHLSNSNAKTPNMVVQGQVAQAHSTAADVTVTKATTKATTPGTGTTVASVAPTTTSNNLVTPNSATSVGSNANILGDIMGHENSPSLDGTTLWTNAPTPTGAGSCHLLPLKSSSRPASSYGNISSTGVSPNVKRKRYMYHNRGNESDSTSMSADSGTSRQSLMTHMSSSRQRLASSSLQHSNFSGSQHQQHAALSNQHHSHYQHHHHSNNHQQQQQQHHHQHPPQMQMSNTSQTQGQKIFQSLSHHAIVTGSPMAGSGPCQFTQPAFPIRSPQIVASSFIESPQYLTAIPVQPVIAPFQVAPVISPLPNQHEMLAGPVVMTSNQSQLQEQLQRKHDDLQKLIIQQQDELRIVSEQLLLARYTLLQPMMSMNYSQPEAVTMGNNTRNFNFNNNAVQQQFNQYGFAMKSSEMEIQQMMLQQQQSLEQQLQHNQAQQDQQQHQTNHFVQQSNTQASHQQQHAQHDQMLLNRNVPDLDQLAQEELDAFLSLSPLHNIDITHTGPNQISTNPNTSTAHANTANANTANANSANPSVNNNVPLMETSPFKSNPNHPASTSEDSLFSYMQMAADSSHTINFNMTIDDGLADAHNDEPKRNMSTTTPIITNATTNHQHQPLRQMVETQASQQATPQRRTQRSPFFSPHPFSNLAAISSQAPSVNNANVSSSSAPASVNNDGATTLPNELDRMLPYQLGPEPSPILFNSNSHASEANQ